MIYELKIEELAKIETMEAYLYYEDLQDELGERFLDKLDEFYKRIQENPKHFAVKNNPFREAYIKEFPYIIIYAIEKNKVVVYSVFNTYQDPDTKVGS